MATAKTTSLNVNIEEATLGCKGKPYVTKDWEKKDIKEKIKIGETTEEEDCRKVLLADKSLFQVFGLKTGTFV